MRRISLALALVGAVAVGCSGGAKAPSDSTGIAKGVTGQYYYVNLFSPPIGGYVESDVGGIKCGASTLSVNKAVTPWQYVYTYLPGANACGTNGQTQFQWADTVTLTAFPDGTNAFLGWAGDCSGYAPCVLTAGADKSVVAIFGKAGGGHPNFMDPALHVPAYQNGMLNCASCHGPTLEGQGIAPSCATCHALPLPQSKPENCTGCHGSGSFYPITTVHARPNQVAVSGVSLGNATNDLLVNFNVSVSGAPSTAFTNVTQARIWVYNSTIGAGLRTTITVTNPVTVVSNGAGSYTATIPGFGPSGPNALLAPFGTTSFLFNVNTGPVQPAATVVAHYTPDGQMAGKNVDDQACFNCHGNNVFSSLTAGVPDGHENVNPIGVEACRICHDRTDTSETRLGTSIAGGTANGTRLMGYVHGIHNSHNMPGAVTTDGNVIDGGIYYRNGSPTNNAATRFSIGFPGYMFNCSTCHTGSALAAIAAMPVAWKNCMSCHVGPPTGLGVAAGFAWAGFGVPNTGTNAVPVFAFGNLLIDHAGYNAATPQTTCTACHAGTIAPATLAGFHNGLKTERAGLIWDGADQSVVEGARFALAVTGVSRVGTNYLVTWTASYNGAAVDPCNTDFAVGPVFLGVVADAANGKAASNMQFIKAYGQGDDWVNAGRPGSVSPGQPATSATLTTANTACSSSVATTTTPIDTFVAAGTRGTMALQGKPQLRFPAAAGTTGEFITARAKSPTYNFVVPAAPGAVAAGAARRSIVDTAKCLMCHKGTLYQHGGNRVDNVDLCVTCHNVASSEQNNRVLFGVTAAEAYDGKPGETYDMRTMVHAIHSAGETGKSYVIYRTRGIYFFGNAASFADAVATRNWPTNPALGVSCLGGEGLPVTYWPVYGSVANGTTDRVPVVGAGGVCDTTNGPLSTNGVWQIHNVVLVEYPRPLSDCGACHVSGTESTFGDQSQRMAVTVDAGASPWGNQLDDVLRGAGAQSCMTCHQSGVPATQAALQQHATDNGFAPQSFATGRDALINIAICGATTCP